MKQNSEELKQQDDDNYIDIAIIIRSLLKNKKFILKIAALFLFVGILIAIFSTNQYTVSSVMLPQSSEKNASGLSGLAAMAGITLGGTTDNIPPQLYSQILNNISFQRELINTPIKFPEASEPISSLEYYTSGEYNKPGVGSYIKKYTIGLPGLIYSIFKGNKGDGEARELTIPKLSEDEKKCSDILLAGISLDVKDKDGYVTLQVVMSDPYVAAQVAERVQELLQKYLTEFKIAKVQSNLEFIQERYDEAQKEFEEIQTKRAIYKDANQSIYSARAQAESEKWDNRYRLAFDVYSELAKQLEQAKIHVKETIPMLTIVTPVTIPLEKSAPRRSVICIMALFLGVATGCCLVIFMPYVADITGFPRLKRFIKE